MNYYYNLMNLFTDNAWQTVRILITFNDYQSLRYPPPEKLSSSPYWTRQDEENGTGLVVVE